MAYELDRSQIISKWKYLQVKKNLKGIWMWFQEKKNLKLGYLQKIMYLNIFGSMKKHGKWFYI